MKKAALLFAITITIISCSKEEKCQDCYIIEEVEGVTNKHFAEVKCGDDIDTFEARSATCVEGNCYFSCEEQ